MSKQFRRTILGTLLPGGAVALAQGQCVPQWSAYTGPQLDNGVWCVAVWDPDGSGPSMPQIVAGGNFESAGSTHLGFVGSWTGSAWQVMGSGVNGTVESVAVFDADGSGPSGAEPVIGGNFTHSAATQVNRIASFRNGQWVALGTGVSGSINTITSWGSDLAVGGVFFTAGSVFVQGLALWNGTAWRAFADEHAAGPRVLANLGGTLYAGGLFSFPPQPQLMSVLRLKGNAWIPPSTSQHNNEVWAFTLFRGQVIAAGGFTSPGSRITVFSNGSWQPLGLGLNGPVNALCVFDPDGPGPMPDLLIAGGNFTMAGGIPAANIAAWDGSNWSPLGSGTTAQVRALTVWNNQLVVVAGDFTSPGMAFWGCPQQPTPCYPNCDASTTTPSLTANDFMCFLNKFANRDPYANCDNSTVSPALTANDFQCFINKYAAGCN